MKYTKPEDRLLTSNSIKFESKLSAEVKGKIKENLLGIAAQKPNKKVFGFIPVKLWFYTAANIEGDNTKFRKWMKTKVGEPPVILDTSLCSKNKQLFENYLFNYGYFKNQVKYEIIEKKNKRAKVNYYINVDPVWKIGNVEFIAGKTHYEKLVKSLSAFSVLAKNTNFEITKLKAERDRIEKVLKNEGYYFFSRDYVSFTLDSNTTKGVVNIKMSILPPTDSTIHQQFKIRRINVYEDFMLENTNDTTSIDTIREGNVFFYYKKEVVKPKIMLDAIYIRTGDLYMIELHNKTIRRLNELGVFRFITVDYQLVKDSGMSKLDCNILLTPSKKHSFGASGEVNINIEGFLGLAGTLSYRNKNLTKRADLFSIDVSGGVQFLFLKEAKAKPFTWDLGFNATYQVNRFLFPLKSTKKSRNLFPKTFFNLSYNFESRYELNELRTRVFLYNLHNFNFGMAYDWTQNRFIHHTVFPFNINFYIFPQRGETFINRLDANPSLKNTFSEQFIIGPSYTFIYSDQLSKTDKRYFYYRLNIETAGNILYSGFALADINKDITKPYTIAGRPFSQFLRTDHDYRAYLKVTNHSSFVWRGYLGIGLPYGNSAQMPFVKQFFVGGPNSLRGFNIREIGPGGYVDTTIFNSNDSERKNYGFFNQTGDIKIETNAEFRFDIYRWLKGAFFVDAGNVWLMRKDTTRENAEFNFKRFWNEFALDFGAGIRLDFSFFVIRLDYGFPIRDPRLSDKKRWTFEKGQFQLAVGYPF